MQCMNLPFFSKLVLNQAVMEKMISITKVAS